MVCIQNAESVNMPNGHVVKKENFGVVNPQWRSKETLNEGSRDWGSGLRSATDLSVRPYTSLLTSVDSIASHVK